MCRQCKIDFRKMFSKENSLESIYLISIHSPAMEGIDGIIYIPENNQVVHISEDRDVAESYIENLISAYAEQYPYSCYEKQVRRDRNKWEVEFTSTKNVGELCYKEVIHSFSVFLKKISTEGCLELLKKQPDLFSL